MQAPPPYPAASAAAAGVPLQFSTQPLTVPNSTVPAQSVAPLNSAHVPPFAPPPLMASVLEPPPPGMSPPPSQKVAANIPGLTSHMQIPASIRPLPMLTPTIPPSGQLLPASQPHSGQVLPSAPPIHPPPGFACPPRFPGGGAPFIPDLSRPPPGAPGSALVEFFSDKWAPKPGVPHPYNSYVAPPPPAQPPFYGAMPVELQPPQYVSHPSHPVPPVYDQRILPLSSSGVPRRMPGLEVSSGKRSRRNSSPSSDSSYSSRSPTPPRPTGPSRKDRYSRRRGDRRRSRSREKRGRRYDSPEKFGYRRGHRASDLRAERSDKSSPSKTLSASPSTAAVAATSTSNSNAPAISPTPKALDPVTISAAKPASAPASSGSVPGLESVPNSAPKTVSSDIANSASTPSVPTVASADSQKTSTSSIEKGKILGDAALDKDEKIPDASEKASQSVSHSTAPKVFKADSATTAVESRTPSTTQDDAVSDIKSADSGSTDEATDTDALEKEELGDVDANEDVLELGIDEDELLAEVQLEEHNAEPLEDKAKRHRRDSDEFRKRREERWRHQQEERERRRRQRQREEEERRKKERERREERERLRRERDKEAEVDRAVGRGKTLPDRPSVVKISSKLKAASGDETSEALSSQAQSPKEGAPDLDIMDEDALLAVFRERALRSMREKQREKFLAQKEQRRMERIQKAHEQAAEPKKQKTTEEVSSKTENHPVLNSEDALGTPSAVDDRMTQDPEVEVEAPKEKSLSAKPAKHLTTEEMEEKLLMSSDEEADVSEASEQHKPIEVKPKPIIVRILPPSANKDLSPTSTSSAAATSAVLAAPTSSSASSSSEPAPVPKKIILLKSSKWSTKKDDQDKENRKKLEASRAPTLLPETKKKIVSLVSSRDRIVAKVPSPKPPSALDRLGAPVEDNSSSEALTSSSSSSSVEEIGGKTKARPSVVKLAAAVKASEPERIFAYELKTTSKEPLFESSEEGSAEDRWNDAIAQSKKRKAEMIKAAASAVKGRETISYEDLDSSYGASSRVSSSDDKVTVNSPCKESAIKPLMEPKFSVEQMDSASSTTKADLMDLLDLTEPISTRSEITADKLLGGINIADYTSKKKVPVARPNWGRRRIEAPDSSSSTSRKLVIRRSTGPAAVALATGGDVGAEIDTRKRRLMKEEASSFEFGDRGANSPSLSPERNVNEDQVVKTTTTTRRKVGGIQRPAWLATKPEKSKSASFVSSTVRVDPAILVSSAAQPKKSIPSPARSPVTSPAKSPIQSPLKSQTILPSRSPEKTAEAVARDEELLEDDRLKNDFTEKTDVGDRTSADVAVTSSPRRPLTDVDLVEDVDLALGEPKVVEEKKLDSDDEDLFRAIDEFLS